MKTRIISGAIFALIIAATFVSQLYFPVILVAVMAILCGIAVKEALYSTGLCENKTINILGIAYSVLYLFLSYFSQTLPILSKYKNETLLLRQLSNNLTLIFIGVIFVVVLKLHSKLKIQGVLAAIVFPVILSYAFNSITTLASSKEFGLLYLILLFCWSSVADTGAYFVGVFTGRHKMAPVISPKKSWEGFFGGIAYGVLSAILVVFIYGKITGYYESYLKITLLSIVFVVLGVVGDLSASIIKRKCEIKDFGNLLPGHGGVLDRFDSILMISPFFCFALNLL